jgi:hypothetical protein
LSAKPKESFLRNSLPLLDLQALSLSTLHNKEFESLYLSTIQTFNKIQAQVFQALYTAPNLPCFGCGVNANSEEPFA